MPGRQARILPRPREGVRGRAPRRHPGRFVLTPRAAGAPLPFAHHAAGESAARTQEITMGFIKEFTDFAVKGNALDLAVGVIIGAAFGKVVNSIVTDIIMPPIGLAIGGVNFTDLQWVIKPAVEAKGEVAAQAAVAIKYGSFMDNIFQFVIIALSVFVAIKFMNKIVALRDLEHLQKITNIASKATDRVAGATGLSDDKKKA
jgi:large conductance mechanosensitive channel